MRIAAWEARDIGLAHCSGHNRVGARSAHSHFWAGPLSSFSSKGCYAGCLVTTLTLSWTVPEPEVTLFSCPVAMKFPACCESSAYMVQRVFNQPIRFWVQSTLNIWHTDGGFRGKVTEAETAEKSVGMSHEGVEARSKQKLWGSVGMRDLDW